MVKFPDELIADTEQSAVPDKTRKKRKTPKPFGRFLRILGPGIVTGAADDDPSGIATYSQAGAQFGFSLPWTMLFTLPLMTAVQEACMRIGAVTGKGLAAVVRERYPKIVLYPIVLLVVCANTLNIGSDIGAMAASTRLIIPIIPFSVLAVGFAILIILLEVLIPYRTYIRILKWLAMALFAYFITAFLIAVPWVDVLKSTLIPQVQFNRSFLYIIVGIFGTTISPYLFFWQTSNVVEDSIAKHKMPQSGGIPKLTKSYLKNLRIDNAVGMLFSNVTAWFIIVVGALVLNQNGVTNINTAADAARALEPLVHTFPNAGFLAKLIFSIGIIGIGLQSIPVLAGSSAYAVAETFSWREGLFRKFKQSRNFYFVIIVGTLIGLVFNFIGFDPIKALIFTAVFNGVAAVPLIYFITRLSSRNDVMGEHKSGLASKLGLWAAFVLMGVFAIALLVSFL
ncbi:MAG: divalent metal cation transporter [Candidatus Pacebacteria bacterium]|nr:divalent metal cation transporter [Candidatus Paceibacterota bacterium]